MTDTLRARNLANALRERFPANYSTKYAARKATFDNALLLIGAPAYHNSEINEAAQGRFTSKGLQEQYRERMASPNILGRLKKDQAELQAAREELALKRAQLGTPQFDKTDLVGAALRKEARDLFRSLPPTDKYRLLFGVKERGIKPDPEMQISVLERGAQFSGLPEDRYLAARDEYVRTQFAPQLAELDEQADVLDHVETALHAAVNIIKVESGLIPCDADRWVDEVAPF